MSKSITKIQFWIKDTRKKNIFVVTEMMIIRWCKREIDSLHGVWLTIEISHRRRGVQTWTSHNFHLHEFPKIFDLPFLILSSHAPLADFARTYQASLDRNRWKEGFCQGGITIRENRLTPTLHEWESASRPSFFAPISAVAANTEMLEELVKNDLIVNLSCQWSHKIFIMRWSIAACCHHSIFCNGFNFPIVSASQPAWNRISNSNPVWWILSTLHGSILIFII